MKWIVLVALLALARQAWAEDGLNLARTKQCFDCHGMSTRVAGPSFADIARKYRHDKLAREVLTEKIVDHGVDPDEARRLAGWVLEQRLPARLSRLAEQQVRHEQHDLRHEDQQ